MSSIDLFISHSSKDSNIASVLVQLLRDSLNLAPDNIRCTSIEGYGLSGGARTDDQLREEVVKAKSFIALITDVSYKSTYVLLEIGARWGTGLNLIPLLASGATAAIIGDPLEGFHALSSDKKEDIYILVDNIARVLDRKQNSVATYESSARRLLQTSRSEAKMREKITISAPLNDYKTAPKSEGNEDLENTKYIDHIVERGELDALHQFCTMLIPNGWARLDQWRERYNKNPKIFHMVKAVTKKGFDCTEKLVGSFALTPITEETCELLEKCQLTGIGFTSHHITAPHEKPAALYLTGIVAVGIARGFTEMLVSWKLQQEAEEGNRLIYTRPLTDDGIRLVKKYEFSPVDPTITYEAGKGHVFKKEIY